MREIEFAFIREGNSDDGLIPHIQNMILLAGAHSVTGASRQYKGSVADKLGQVLAEPGAPPLIFVHRDSDGRDSEPRRAEITSAALAHSCIDRVVPVVPVQEMEAWLLTDVAAIRAVVGRPSGRADVNVPVTADVERTAGAKEVLRAACLEASETTGVRRRKESSRFNQRRATLLERLDIHGPVTGLPSWQIFVTDLTAAVRRLLTDESLPGV